MIIVNDMIQGSTNPVSGFNDARFLKQWDGMGQEMRDLVFDKATQDQLTRGERMVEILKQGQFEPLPVSKQVMIIYVGTNGFLDDIPTKAVRKFEIEFYGFMDKLHPDIALEIETKKELDDGLKQRLNAAIAAFKKEFSA